MLVPYTAVPIWEITVGVPPSNGDTWMCAARADRPRNMTPSPMPMSTSVCRAFRHDGSLNAGTPLEMASTPVTAAPPEANACSTTYKPAPHEEALPGASVRDVPLDEVTDDREGAAR